MEIYPENAVIEANGSIPELLTDIAVVINAIYTQFSTADRASAAAFRAGIKSIVNDSGSIMWRPLEGQTGIIFPKPEGEA